MSVCGHAGYVQAVAHAVASAGGMKEEELDAMLKFELEDAEGILVPLYAQGKVAIHMKADHAKAAERAEPSRDRALKGIESQLKKVKY